MDEMREMAIADLRDCIARWVAGGFDAPEDIAVAAVDYLSDEYGEEVLWPHVERLTQEAIDEHLRVQGTWPALTDCDRLDLAFSKLEERGIVCRQNFSCCGTCGSAEIWDEFAQYQASGGAARGYAFYHVQDTDSAVEGEGLYLNYGSAEEGEAAALAVASEIIAEINRQGLQTVWDGSWSTRLFVRLDWKRRRQWKMD